MSRRRALRLGVGSVALFVAALYLVPLPRGTLMSAEAYRFLDRRGQPLEVTLAADGYRRMHTDAKTVPAVFLDALLFQEDRGFRHHPGVNPFALARAALANAKARRIVSGGSTITMQLARMLDRRPRTVLAKLIESFRALQLEARYSKDDILSMYLSLTPYGGNVEGLEGAAWTYFGKPAAALSLGEAALLVVVPRAPKGLRPDRHPAAAKAARDRLLKAMAAAGVVASERAARAMLESVNATRHADPALIPHWATHWRAMHPDRVVVRTTLDAELQARTLAVLRARAPALRDAGIGNAAVVAIDNRSRELRVSIGSLDVNDRVNLGANDGTRAKRSPGSTLKPFLYGLAFDAGLVAEKTVLFDVPQVFAGYAPQNFLRRFLGPVTVREALTESLNVVAVRLSADLGMTKLYDLLRRGGITSLKHPPEYYGLPLVLGGVEVSLAELTNLYASLANDGVYQPLRTEPGTPPGAPVRLLSTDAAWLVSHILTDVTRPDFPASWRFTRDRAEVAWKTGTSYGQRDAWSVGYTPELTIGVWLGNFDGAPSSSLVGARAAAPLLFDLFQALLPSPRAPWFPRPEGVGEREVCAVCGLPAGRWCTSVTRELYLKNVKGPATTERCAIPQAITVDSRSGLEATDATPRAARATRIFDIWPPEVARFLHEHGVPVRDAPPYDPQRMAGVAYYPPKILSPRRDTVHYRRPSRVDPRIQGLMLKVATTNRVRQVYWFLDDRLIAQGDPADEVPIDPPPGRYRIRVLDEVGGHDEVQLVVKDERDLTARAP